jgi:Mg-chelatase subunit ChlD
MLSGVLSAAMTISAIPFVSVHADENTNPYPYTMFAASSDEGAITVNAGNFCVNGNVATKGTIVSSGNMNINGTRTENADESMIFIFDKIDDQYFSASNVDEHDSDYTLNELNININVPTEVEGEATLTGNININNALKALEDVNLYGEVKNTNDSVIFSKYGDIVIDSQNVNLNGLVYAPFGSVTINAQNLNLNNVVIIAESIELTCPNVNANNSSSVSSFVGSTSEPLDIPYDEWQYMKDENENDFPDFIEDFNNWYLLKDTDNDKLPDCIEESVNSNPNVMDTDDDNLDDYYEVMVTYTNPSDVDTDDNLIDDCNEDFDDDGLTNLQEYLLNTSPWHSDSDKDTLNDGAEVNTYNTNPLEPDSDFDGLNDADEISLGVLPNNPDTDGDGILDGNEYYSGSVAQELISDDPKVSAITGVYVELDCKGYAENCVKIENTYNIDVMSSDVVGIVGSPVNITSSAEFNTATITFTYDDTLLNDTTEEDLIILWYDRENKGYVMLEDTIVDTVNNTVSCTTTHFSTYLVIDREIWLDSWREKIEYSRQPSVIETAYNIGFVVDVSSSMNSERLSNAKTALNTFIDAMYECDDATLVSFNSSGNVVKNFGTSKSELKSAVSALTASGGTSTNSGLRVAITEMSPYLSSDEKNIIILICDGDVENNNSTKELLQIAKNAEKPINIYTLNVCDADSDVLESIATQTGGVPYKAATAAQIASVMATLQQSTVSSIDMTDSDGDGLYDVYETQGIKYQNGQVYRTDPNKADTDGDGISDFDEVGGAPIAKVVNFFQSEYSCVLCNVNTNPTSVDTDGDTYTDDVDPEPYDYTMIKDFGSDGYIADIEYQAGELNPMALELTAWPYIGDYIFYKLKGEKDVANSAIELMMDDVNNCPYTYLVSDENWLNFCLEFNKYVQTYGEVDRTLHYFRLKLNRAPATLDDMIKTINCATEVNDKWIMCSPQKGRFHMFGEYGSFNIKFISSNNTDNIYEAVYDKNGKLLTESDDYGKNMGTFNYASSSKKGKLHNRLDVSTYEDMKNTYEDYVHRNDNDNPDDNVINKRPRNKQNNSEIDYDAQNHIIQICNKIGIDYELLIDNNFSDKCYSY